MPKSTVKVARRVRTFSSPRPHKRFLTVVISYDLETDTEAELDELLDIIDVEADSLSQTVLRQVSKHGRHKHANTDMQALSIDY